MSGDTIILLLTILGNFATSQEENISSVKDAVMGICGLVTLIQVNILQRSSNHTGTYTDLWGKFH